MMTPAEYEAEIDRLAAALDLEAKARQCMAESLAMVRSELIGLQACTTARRAMVDLDNPQTNAFIVRSTRLGIENLERTLQERFNEGRELGRAEAEEGFERLSA